SRAASVLRKAGRRLTGIMRAWVMGLMVRLLQGIGDDCILAFARNTIQSFFGIRVFRKCDGVVGRSALY
ncbi:MAG: hypothetical protein CVV18_03065, partial [Gammaproteobacteria bacterium HGW-Gammaproteobacteria-8]